MRWHQRIYEPLANAIEEASDDGHCILSTSHIESFISDTFGSHVLEDVYWYLNDCGEENSWIEIHGERMHFSNDIEYVDVLFLCDQYEGCE